MNNTEQNTLEIAKTIQDQLGSRCLFMIGARYFSGTHNSLSFRFRGSSVANHLKITLDPSDTYTVTFTKIHGAKFKEVSKHEGIYCDMLHELIRRVTGLNTNL